MGPCSSAEDGSQPEGAWGEHHDELEMEGQRSRSGKDGEDIAIEDCNENRPEDDGHFFEFEVDEVREGEQFLSVRPWKAAAAVKPDNTPEENRSKPDVTYKLEHVYGYRCQDTKANVYYNPSGNVVYFTACLGVILDKEENRQTYFGGGEVDDESK